MPASFDLRIVTPQGILYSGQISSLRAPGTEGGFGVLAHHAPMVAALEIGQLIYQEDGKRPELAISGGIVEVSREGVRVLAETAEYGEKIDVERARAARDRARERLARRSEVDVTRADTSLRRALNRLRVAGE